MKKDLKIKAFAVAIGTIILLMCFSIPAHAEYREEVSIMEDGYYMCEAFHGNVKIYTVYRGRCVDHQSVVSDNNHIMKSGNKLVDTKEMLGIGASSNSTFEDVEPNLIENRAKIDARHAWSTRWQNYLREKNFFTK